MLISKTAKKLRVLSKQGKKIIYSVHMFLDEQKKKCSLVYNKVKAIAGGTSLVSESVVRNVDLWERRSSLAIEISPKKKYSGHNGRLLEENMCAVL